MPARETIRTSASVRAKRITEPPLKERLGSRPLGYRSEMLRQESPVPPPAANSQIGRGGPLIRPENGRGAFEHHPAGVDDANGVRELPPPPDVRLAQRRSAARAPRRPA